MVKEAGGFTEDFKGDSNENPNEDHNEYTKFCRLTAYVKPRTKKTINELSERLGISPSKIICSIVEKHLLTLEPVKKRA